MARYAAFPLGSVSLADCLVFCMLLAPELLLQAGFWPPVLCTLKALPFVFFQMPLAIARDRWHLVTERRQSRGIPKAPAFPSLFEDVVLRCVHWGFAHIEPSVGRVFFSSAVAQPFHRFRHMRHGHVSDGALESLRWHTHHDKTFRGLWITHDPTTPPDIIVFFVHGGGFVLGSSHFYLEFLLAWTWLLLHSETDSHASAPFRNPAVFSLDYTLAPDAAFPTQLLQATHAYKYVLRTAANGDPSRIVVAGDSAGGALVLSLLLYLAQPEQSSMAFASTNGTRSCPVRPAMAVLISPWVRLWSSQYENSDVDYVDVDTLEEFAAQYTGGRATTRGTRRKRKVHKNAKHDTRRKAGTEAETVAEPVAETTAESIAGISDMDPHLSSPGDCTAVRWWQRACPEHGMLVTYGQGEVFSPEIRTWAHRLQGEGLDVQLHVDSGPGVHAWPVASVFVGSTEQRRLGGLQDIVGSMKQRLAS